MRVETTLMDRWTHLPRWRSQLKEEKRRACVIVAMLDGHAAAAYYGPPVLAVAAEDGASPGLGEFDPLTVSDSTGDDAAMPQDANVLANEVLFVAVYMDGAMMPCLLCMCYITLSTFAIHCHLLLCFHPFNRWGQKHDVLGLSIHLCVPGQRHYGPTCHRLLVITQPTVIDLLSFFRS